MIHLKKIVYSEYISHPTFPNPMSTMFYNDSEFALWSQIKNAHKKIWEIYYFIWHERMKQAKISWKSKEPGGFK